MHPAQAAAIVSELEKVPTTVPSENLQAAEQQLVNLARTFKPKELRDAADRMRHILDTDGPEPEEHRAYRRESLTLQSADKGVKFRGYLANENAELLRALIHDGAKPHKTIDGEPDPRTRDKRQADALTTVLNTAAVVTHTTAPGAPPAADGPPPGPSASSAATSPGANAGTPSTADGHMASAGAPSTADDPVTTAGTTSTTDDPATTAGTTSTADDPVTNLARSDRSSTESTGGNTSAADTAPTASPAPAHYRDTSTGPAARTTPTGAATPAGAAAPTSADSQAASGDTHHGGAYIPGHGPKAHLTITIDYNALKTATTDATGDLVFGDNLSAAAVRRIACDAQVIPIVLGSKSQPLDVGTTKRLVTAPIRLALNARDRGCVVCGAPPIQCEAHHLVHWIDGGDTSVSNLVLLCKRHHLDLHAGHWHIEITNDIVHVTRPAWATPAPVPPGRYKPPTHHDTPTTDSPSTDTPTTGTPSAGDPTGPSTNHPHTNDPQHRARTQTNPPDLPINATPAEIRQAIWGDDSTPTTPVPSRRPETPSSLPAGSPVASSA